MREGSGSAADARESSQGAAGCATIGPRDEATDLAACAARLLAWYDRAARDLPWRERKPDAYRVWVSEVMLQQTRAATVAPYYRRWLERFPDVRALARADLEDVLRAWEGLGYYSRARRLHAAARVVCERHDGDVPGDADVLRDLPGVGPYTAGAIASIAFGRDVPAVDANARRVLSRFHDLPRPTSGCLERIARTWLVPGRAGDLNQAFMDLGATVCTPRDPACGGCPLRDGCGACAAGTVPHRPAPTRGRKVPERWHVVAVILQEGRTLSGRGRTLLRRRPSSGLLGGLWEFPTEAVGPGAATARAAERTVLAPEGALRAAGHARRVRHAYSHFLGVYEAFAFRAQRAFTPVGDPPHRWVPVADLASVPMPRAMRRIAGLCLPGDPAPERCARRPSLPPS